MMGFFWGRCKYQKMIYSLFNIFTIFSGCWKSHAYVIRPNKMIDGKVDTISLFLGVLVKFDFLSVIWDNFT